MFFNQSKTVQAKLVGSTLVAAFHTSNPNLIWKYDLERNHSFTLTLQGEDGDFELGVTSPKGEFYAVARFATREDAEEALAAVQKVLMKRNSTSTGWWKVLTATVLSLALLFIIFVLWVNLRSVDTALNSTGKVKIREGVPLPADQILQPPP